MCYRCCSIQRLAVFFKSSLFPPNPGNLSVSHFRSASPVRKFSSLVRRNPVAKKGVLSRFASNLPQHPEKMSALSQLWQRYLRLTDVHPLKVQAVTATVFAALGNLISQTMVEKRAVSDIDWASAARFAAIALFITFPTVRCWLWFLENRVRPGKFAPLRRVLYDQLLFAPINYVFFISIMGLIEGGNFDDVKRRLKNDYVDVMLTNWKVWPAVQLINFYFVPFNQRILFLSVISLFWNTYLAYVVRQGGLPVSDVKANSSVAE